MTYNLSVFLKGGVCKCTMVSPPWNKDNKGWIKI